MIRVLIIDRHPVVREGLKAVFRSQVDLEVTGELETVDALTVDLLERSTVALISTNIACSTGIDVVEFLGADCSTLIFSEYPEELYAPRLLKAGADGYVRLTASPKTITEAVRTVARGETYVSTALARVIADQWKGGAEGALDQLSNREFQVIRLVAAGESIDYIAELLCVSEATVSTYKRRIRDKLGVSNDVEMAWFAWSQGLVNHPN